MPRQTLHDQISGRVKHGTNPGPQPYLSKAEEKDLVDFCQRLLKLDMAKVDNRYLLFIDNNAMVVL